MQWLLGLALTTEVTEAIADWVHNCYLPVQTGTMEAREGCIMEELLPWGDTALAPRVSHPEVVPGAQPGIQWCQDLPPLSLSSTAGCGVNHWHLCKGPMMIWSQNPRTFLSPISSGPWLDDVGPTYGGVGILTVSVLCLIGTVLWWWLAPQATTSILMGVLPCVGVGGLLVGLIQLPFSLLQRRRTQTCPACLHQMNRGATTCPSCQFQPPQEDV
jgi:hypothetical protein